MRPRPLLLSASLLLSFSCRQQVPRAADADEHGFSAPTAHTIAAQKAAAAALPPEDPLDAEEAGRGLIAREPSLVVESAEGKPIFAQDRYAFLSGLAQAPESINPSLFRQARLNNQHGLFQVTEGVYQLRGYDLANMTLIRGDRGWIVVDPLTSRETAARALAFARQHLGDRPVSAILFTHSHIDHFGGALAVATPEEVKRGQVAVIAPRGFLEEATSENVLAGPAMGRRATYMYGRDLPRSPRGKVDNGLGKEPAVGAVGILPPTQLIDDTPQTLQIDGVELIFQYTPGSEAPAELTFYLPQRRAFCGAEVLSRTMHNLYTLRGAKVRDAQRWAGYIRQVPDLFPQAEVMFFSHHWPVWGRARIRLLLDEQADTFQYIHDQTLRLANQGHGPREIAERLHLPASLRRHYWNRGYYGTLRHNVKAVYQMYFGWYDSNPAELDPLPRLDRARRYVEALGGPSAVMRRAQRSFEEGDYRWVAEVLNHLVSAEPANVQARSLLARAYDQLGYRAESTAWRNAYLSAAQELRHGPPRAGVKVAATADLLNQTAPEQFMQMLQVALNGEKAADLRLTLNLHFSDLSENHIVEVSNGVLHHRRGPPAPQASATLTLTRPMLVKLMTGQAGLKALLDGNDVAASGSALDLVKFFSLLDRPDMAFPIVTPKG